MFIFISFQENFYGRDEMYIILRVWGLTPRMGASLERLDDPRGEAPDVCLQPDDYDEKINPLPEG